MDFTTFLEYRVGPAVGINLTYRYDAELTDVVIIDAPGSATGDELKFSRHQVFIGARWFL